MSVESLARYRIDKRLGMLGWKLDAKKESEINVRLGRHLKSHLDVKRLKGTEPDYTLYGEDSSIPIGIIEAKRPQHPKLSDALVQADGYASKLNLENAMLFASDGNIVLARHVSGEPAYIDGEPVCDFLPQDILSKIAVSKKIDTGEHLKNANDLIRIFERASNALRKDGVETGLSSLAEFCILIFIKTLSEKNRNLPNCGWDEISNKRGRAMRARYIEIINKYQKRYNGLLQQTKIRTPSVLEDMVRSIDTINFSGTDLDIKGGAYEYFLSTYSAASKSILGQYFTPRHITRMMASMLDVKFNETIYDPFCGTGGMLLSCYEQLYRQIKPRQKPKLDNQTLYGNDFAPSASQLAKMNMVIVGDGHSNITCRDSIGEGVQKKYNAVITNIPFNLDPRNDGSVYNVPEETDSNALCVHHCLQSLKPGGRAALIVPETIAYQPRYRNLRRIISSNHKLSAVIRLPRPTFKKYTSAQTCILFIEEAHNSSTNKFSLIHLKSDGFSAGTWREPTYDSDIPQFLNKWGSHQKEYKQVSVKHGDEFFKVSQHQESSQDSWSLGELIDVVREKTPLNPDEFYIQPGLNSRTNTVSPYGESRLGRNVSNYRKGKVLAHAGDLMIATLHTQRGNGLFAIADQTYMTTSQIVGKIREDVIDKYYLIIQLRKKLPTLETTDLVGRETYKEDEILGIRIQKPTSIDKNTKKLQDLMRQKFEIEHKIKELEGKEK